MIEQRSLDWFRARLGKFTGSTLGGLMTPGRGKGVEFGGTAMAVIHKVAVERVMLRRNPGFVADDVRFGTWIGYASPSSKAMDYGTQTESLARECASRLLGLDVVEASSCAHATIPNFAASPDGVFPGGVLEIKCPQISTFAEYASQICTADDLRKVERGYWYQVQAEMMCAGADSAIWCAYCEPAGGILAVPVEPQDWDIIEARVRRADAVADDIAQTIEAKLIYTTEE